MASRSSKKKNNIDNKPKFSQEYYASKTKIEKINTSMPFIMLVSLLLIAIFFFLPLTGLSVSVNPDKFIPVDPEAPQQENPVPKENVELSSSVNSFSIIFTGLGKHENWIEFLSKGLVNDVKGDFGDALKDSVSSIIYSTMTFSQMQLVAKVMDMQLYISMILLSLWLITIIVSCILIPKHKSILAIMVLFALISLLSIGEFITLVVVALGGMAGASFTVNVGAYLLPILTLSVTILLIKAYVDQRHCNMIIKSEEEKINETMSSLS